MYFCQFTLIVSDQRSSLHVQNGNHDVVYHAKASGKWIKCTSATSSIFSPMIDFFQTIYEGQLNNSGFACMKMCIFEGLTKHFKVPIKWS